MAALSSFRPTLAPLAIPKLNIQMKKNWLQLDSNLKPCSNNNNTRPAIQLHKIKIQPFFIKTAIHHAQMDSDCDVQSNYCYKDCGFKSYSGRIFHGKDFKSSKTQLILLSNCNLHLHRSCLLTN